MDVLTAKERFRGLLKKYLKQKKIRQQRLAAELELTASAVSQMIKGKILFSMKQLNTICEILELEPTQTFELQGILIRLRTSSSVGQTPFSRLVFALRCKRGLNHRQLSNLTGIPAAKLASFEADDDVSFSPDDAARLAPVLGCEARELLASANLTMNTSFYYQPTPPEMLEVGADYTVNSLQELPIDEMRDFRAGESVFAYASKRNANQLRLPFDQPYPALAVTGRAAEFGYSGNDIITVLIGDEFKADCACTVLARSKRNGYLLVEGEGDSAVRFMTNEKVEEELLWVLPVYQAVIRMRPCVPEAAEIPAAN